MWDLRDKLFGAGDHPSGQFAQPGGLGAFISAILPNIYIFAGLILFAYLVFGGFLIIRGGGDPKSVDQGKDAVTKALVGFLLIFASYWIIQIVQIVTGIPILNSTL